PEGSTCDYDEHGIFECLGPPGTGTLCGACDETQGIYCGPRTTCIATGTLPPAQGPGICFQYCCFDGDCGPNGICVPVGYSISTLAADMGVGVCVLGTNISPVGPPACNLPAGLPSGSCIGGYHG